MDGEGAIEVDEAAIIGTDHELEEFPIFRVIEIEAGPIVGRDGAGADCGVNNGVPLVVSVNERGCAIFPLSFVKVRGVPLGICHSLAVAIKPIASIFHEDLASDG